MSELVEFLKARLDEDEQAALNAQPGSWRYDRERFTVTCSGYPVASWRHEGELASGSPLLDRTGEYVERFDPERVMAEVAAKRRRLARHVPTEDPLHGTLCSWCSVPQVSVYQAWPCADIRDDVAVYADHPDYREEWRP